MQFKPSDHPSSMPNRCQHAVHETTAPVARSASTSPPFAAARSRPDGAEPLLELALSLHLQALRMKPVELWLGAAKELQLALRRLRLFQYCNDFVEQPVSSGVRETSVRYWSLMF